MYTLLTHIHIHIQTHTHIKVILEQLGYRRKAIIKSTTFSVISIHINTQVQIIKKIKNTYLKMRKVIAF